MLNFHGVILFKTETAFCYVQITVLSLVLVFREDFDFIQ